MPEPGGCRLRPRPTGRKGGGRLTQATPRPHLAAASLGRLSPRAPAAAPGASPEPAPPPGAVAKESLLCGAHPVPAPQPPRRREPGPAPRERRVPRPPSNLAAPGPAPRPAPTGPLGGQKPVGLRGSVLPAGAAPCAGRRGEGPSSLRTGAQTGSASPPVPLGAHTHLGYTRLATEAGGSTHLPSHVGNMGPRDRAPGPSLPLDLRAGGWRSWVLGSWTRAELVGSGSAQGRCVPGPPGPPGRWSPWTAGSQEEHVSLLPLEHTRGPQALSPLHRRLQAWGAPDPRGLLHSSRGPRRPLPPTRGPGQQPGVTRRVPSLCPGVGGAAASLPIHSRGLGSWGDGLCRQQS